MNSFAKRSHRLRNSDCTLTSTSFLIALIPARGLSEHAWVLTNNYVVFDYVTVGFGLGARQESLRPITRVRLLGDLYETKYCVLFSLSFFFPLSLFFFIRSSLFLIYYAYFRVCNQEYQKRWKNNERKKSDIKFVYFINYMYLQIIIQIIHHKCLNIIIEYVL